MQPVRRKKICMLGAAAAGKTSLVARYSGVIVTGGYQSTLGARVTRAVVTVSERLRELVVWDIKGESDFYRIPPAYLLGSDGYVLVADGTRRATVEHALDLRDRMRALTGEIPHFMLINKMDLRDVWEVDEDLLAALRTQVPGVYCCSARGGIALHNAMEALARAMWGGT